MSEFVSFDPRLFAAPAPDSLRMPIDRLVSVEELATAMFELRPKYVGGIDAFYKAISRAVQRGKMTLHNLRPRESGDSFLRARIDPTDVMHFANDLGFGLIISESMKGEGSALSRENAMKNHPPVPKTAQEHFASFDPTRPKYSNQAMNDEYTVAWWDQELKASMWWQLTNIEPQEAAMLLCGLNPQEGSNGWRTLGTAGEPDTNDYRSMLRWFEDAAKDKEPRTLSDWLAFANSQSLKIHSWITVWRTAGGGTTAPTPPVQATEEIEEPTREAQSASETNTEAAVTPGPTNQPPTGLPTGHIAHCFSGLKWTEEQWRKPLGDRPKWLGACMLTPGQRGVRETLWNPVLIGAALIRRGETKANSVRARFQTQHLLKPWLEAWKTYEAEHFDD